MGGTSRGYRHAPPVSSLNHYAIETVHRPGENAGSGVRAPRGRAQRPRAAARDPGPLEIPAVAHAAGILAGLEAPKAHKIARCRWCGGPFVRVWAQWFCANLAQGCPDRQIAHAIHHPTPIEGRSPFFYLPLPLQVDIEESPVKRLLVHGPQGISKSYGGRMSLYARCRKIPGYQALLLRCTYDQLQKNHLQFVRAECDALGDAKYTAGTTKVVEFENGSRIFMGFCDKAADIEDHRGPEWDEVLIEEAVSLLPEAINVITSRDRGSAPAREAMIALGFEEGRSRLLTNPGGRAQMFLEDHYITRSPDRLEYPKYDPQFYGHIMGDIRDNPYLSETYKESVLGGLDADRYEQFAEGRWDIVAGQFFGQWNPTRHVGTL